MFILFININFLLFLKFVFSQLQTLLSRDLIARLNLLHQGFLLQLVSPFLFCLKFVGFFQILAHLFSFHLLKLPLPHAFFFFFHDLLYDDLSTFHTSFLSDFLALVLDLELF